MKLKLGALLTITLAACTNSIIFTAPLAIDITYIFQTYTKPKTNLGKATLETDDTSPLSDIIKQIKNRAYQDTGKVFRSLQPMWIGAEDCDPWLLDFNAVDVLKPFNYFVNKKNSSDEFDKNGNLQMTLILV